MGTPPGRGTPGAPAAGRYPMERLLGAAGHLVLNIRRMGAALVRAQSPGEKRLPQGCRLAAGLVTMERAAREEHQVSEMERMLAHQMMAVRSAERLLEDVRQSVRQSLERHQDAARRAELLRDGPEPLRLESLEELRQVSRRQARPTRVPAVTAVGTEAAGRAAGLALAAVALACFSGFCRGFGGGEIMEMLPYTVRLLILKGARVRFLLGDADVRQVLDQDFSLDLQLPRELVDADLRQIWHQLSVLPALRDFESVSVLSSCSSTGCCCC